MHHRELWVAVNSDLAAEEEVFTAFTEAEVAELPHPISGLAELKNRDRSS